MSAKGIVVPGEAGTGGSEGLSNQLTAEAAGEVIAEQVAEIEEQAAEVVLLRPA
jgi:hypothetical protein